LKEDLASIGIFDTHMSLYLFYRLRQFQNMGFSGFEGRNYSLLREKDYNEWLKSYSVGELWTKNVISGGPTYE